MRRVTLGAFTGFIAATLLATSLAPVLATTDPAGSSAPAASDAAQSRGPAAGRPGPRKPDQPGRVIDNRLSPDEPYAYRVIVTWDSAASGRRARTARTVRLAATSPGIRPATAVTAATEAYELARPLRGRALQAELRRLAATPGVRTVAIDHLAFPTFVPNDPQYAAFQAYLQDASAYGIKAEQAWDTADGSDVTIAILDTGVVAHPDLVSILPGYDFVSNVARANDGDGMDADPSDPGDWVTTLQSTTQGSGFYGCPIKDSSWHGTGVAGTAAARANNGIWIAGVASKAHILPVRVLGKCGGFNSDIANGITWASGGSVPGASENPNPSRILNLSLGAQGACPAVVQNAIDGAVARGSLVVIGAGNDNIDAAGFSPANCANVLTVAATGEFGQRASFSNWGPTVEIGARGTGIRSLAETGTQGPSGIYTTKGTQGTSDAAPMVSGVAALVWSVAPWLTAAEVSSILTTNVTAFSTGTAPSCTVPDKGCGSGIVNASAAVAATIARPPDLASITLAAASDSGVSSTDGITKASSLAFAVTFRESVTGVQAADFTTAGSATGCNLGTPTGSGKDWVLGVTGCSPGTLTLGFAKQSAINARNIKGPATAFTSAQTVIIDKTSPTLGSVALDAGSESGNTSDGITRFPVIVVNAAFNEAVDAPTAAGLTFAGVTGCSLTGVSGTTTQALTLSGCAEGSLTVTVKAGSVVDLAGNTGPASPVASSTIRLDRTGPQVLSFVNQTQQRWKGPLWTFLVTFNEPIVGVVSDPPPVTWTGTATGCAPSYGIGSSTTITITFTGCSEGTLLPRLLANPVPDAAGNAGPAAPVDSTTTVTVDKTKPGMSVMALTAGSDSGRSNSDRQTNAATLTYDLVFSEGVVAPSAAAFQAIGCTVGTPTGSGTTWTLQLTGCAEGVRTLSVTADTITDLGGNTGPAFFLTSLGVTVDRTAPTGITLTDTSPSHTTTALEVTIGGSGVLDCGSITAADLDITNGTFVSSTANAGACRVNVTSTVTPQTQGDTLVSPSGTFSVSDVAGNPSTEVPGDVSIQVDRRDDTPPTVTGLVLTPSTVAPGGEVTITATGSDAMSIVSGSYRFGSTPKGSLSAADGAFGGLSELVTGIFTAPLRSSLQVCVVVTDTGTNVSTPACATLTISGAAGVAAGTALSCIVLADTTVRCMGAGDQGQLGTGLTGDSTLPVAVRTAADTQLSGVTAVVTGATHACALKSDKTVWCWGDGTAGKQGDGATTDRLFAHAVPGLTGVTALAAGSEHTCARLSTKTVKCWGKNSNGQLGDGTITARKSPVAVKNLTGVVAIAAGGAHSCATVGTTKTVKCWGKNTNGQLGDGTVTQRKTPVVVSGLSGVTALAAGTAHTCARLSTQVLRCWGANAKGQLGNGATTEKHTPVAVKTITTASGIAAGGNTSCAVLADGTVRCWGDLAGATTKTPAVVGGSLTGKTALQVAVGLDHRCARLSTGAVVCWGGNARGQLGDGSTTGNTAPARVHRLMGDAIDAIVEPAPTEEPAPTQDPGATAEPAPTDDGTPTDEPGVSPEPSADPAPPADPSPEPSAAP